MIRFRFMEDEKRYLALLSALYRNFATHLPPHLVSACMRDLGKLQDTLLLEGVRQGLAVAEISNLGTEQGERDVRALKAFQAHATVYGSQDTPLRDVEVEWLEKLGIDTATAAGAWLDDNPMRFAPDTFEAWEAERRVVPVLRVPEPVPAQAVPERVTFFLKEEVQDRPDLLDRTREVLLHLVQSGSNPASWNDMILALQRELHVDAGFLDLQMSTPMGRTVLDQCGLFDLRADRLNLQDLLGQQESAAPTDDDSSP